MVLHAKRVGWLHRRGVRVVAARAGGMHGNRKLVLGVVSEVYEWHVL